MSSIPLAIANPLQQQTELVDLASKRQGLKSLLEEQQLQRQQGQINQQKIQEGTITLNDQKAASDAMHEWDGKSLDDLPGLYIKKGASAGSVLSLKNNILEYTKNKALADKDVIDNDMKRHDNIAGAMNNAVVTNRDGSLNSSATAQALDSLSRNPEFVRNLDPSEVQQLPSRTEYFKNLLQTNPEQFQQEWRTASNGHLAESQINKNALDQQDLKDKATANQTATLTNQQAQAKLDALKAWQAKPENAGKTSADFDVAQEQAKAQGQATGKITGEQAAIGGNGMPVTPEQADAKYRNIQFAKARGQKLSDDDKAFVTAYEKQKTLVGTTNFNLQNGGGVSPDTIDALGKGQMRWSDIVNARTPMSVKSAILSEVKAKYPDFNSGDFDVEKKVKETATSGTVGQQLLAIATAREHMQTFGQLADALDNGNVQLLNKIGNTFGVQFGSDKATNLKIAAQAFGGEVGKAFDGAGVTAGEREQAEKAYSDYLSKGQFKGAIQTVDKLLAGKQKAAHEWFDKGTQAKPNFGDTAKPEPSFTVPTGAPAAPKEDNKVLKQDGKIVARSQGGQWVAP